MSHDSTSIGRRAFLRHMVLACSAAIATPGLAGLLGACRQEAGPQRAAEVDFILRSAHPYNLETPVRYFDQFLTPNEAFFVRSHHEEPRVDITTWRLRVVGLVGTELSLSLEELQGMEKVSLTAVLQCSGNGRAFFSKPKVPGVPWEKGAVGNARWAGVRLRDVLEQAGMKPGARHVHLQGADRPVSPTTPRFTRTLPLEKAMHPDTILAYEMNGEPLPHLHGYPLRVIAPGWVGDDWVKWLGELTVSDVEPDNFWFQTAYRYPTRPLKHGEKPGPGEMAPMEEMVVKSLIARPAAGAVLGRGTTPVLGVAWTGGEARISRVDVSADGGRNWAPATLLGEDLPYAWRQWRFDWTPPGPGTHTLMVRATDTHGATQPIGEAPWNPSGYHWNAADTVAVTIRA